jgi:hypothetical protein
VPPPYSAYILDSSAGTSQSESVAWDAFTFNVKSCIGDWPLSDPSTERADMSYGKIPPGICVTSFVLLISLLNPGQLIGPFNQAENPSACSPLVLFYSFIQVVYQLSDNSDSRLTCSFPEIYAIAPH